MHKYLSITTILLLLIAVSQSCKKKDETNPANDTELFALVGQSGYTYYNGTPGITAGVGNSPHGFERVRFNATAQAALDTTGKLPAGNSFPAGSVIVKEIYTSATGSINLYAVMKKDPSSSVSGSGYLWAEFKPDGTASFSTGKKGDGCISCHSGSANRDLARTFDLH
ncbi:MAG: cytochrome P460 family protein [Bacteroidota bacterium]